MKTLIDQPINAGAPMTFRPVIALRPGHKPVAFGTLTYLYVPAYGNLSVPLQAARGDDELMGMDPNQA
ncbi:hypothetical protein L861_15705 [Litchfieldella anticariensis FP35 = DSM 16096]|uniref:Uncharacterized protein n=1 Tax=Litchfieldella anticariensis (strain DSM 16096 / CECT 5854 / CIP 108499 / LMG 22089 / FP35) TaxID=1121939 RepID=S2L332_LITA3|nr:hypothetical protein [Halomonas anticariensis]EPC02154.1 hypothetical protein L861_15705 [Halomonas anticariensis FP35 = DSM 16096]